MGARGMKRVYSERVLEAGEMRELARQLERFGFYNVAVGINYIDFYDKVEIWRIADAARKVYTGDDR